MNNNSTEHLLTQNSLENFLTDPLYNPDLSYAAAFSVATVFDCREQILSYSGTTDYHSLMHNVQKPVLASNRVEELAFFANKLQLMEWTTGLVPVQTIVASSTNLNDAALSLARASTFPNLRCDFFVDIESSRWVLNETETLADCRPYSEYLLKNTGEFYFNGWLNKAYIPFDSPLSVSILRERLNSEMNINIH